ncbi:hypothetical protein N9I00_00695 [bacterium]|nr:hypothetical protein [bacterium]
MAITNVKILLRRGLREEIGVDTLETGEMGFTTDTNQLFVGIDESINEVQFDAFANAHAVIQTWLDSNDNPEPGLKVDEDLVIRNIQDVDALIGAMHFYLENVEWKGNVNFTVGETVYLKEYKYDNHRIPSSEIDAGKTYIIKKIGNTEYRTMGAVSNDINVQFTSLALGPLDGTGEVLEVIGVEDYTHGVVTSKSYDPVKDITITSLYMRHNDAMPAQIIAPNDNSTYMSKSNFGLFKWDGSEWAPEVIDHILNYHPLNANIDYTTNSPDNALGLGGDVAVITGPDRVTYWYKQDTVWQQLGNGTQDFQFHTTDIETQDLDATPLSTPNLRSDGSALVNNDYYIDYSRDLQNGLSLVLSEFDLLSPRIASLPDNSDLATMTLDEINNYYRYDDTTLPVYRTENIAVQNTLDYQLTYAEPETSEVGLATFYIKEKDQAGSNDFTLYDYNNTHRSYYYTKSLVGIPSDISYADTTNVGYVDVPEFVAPYYARSRRNVEVLTENTYNQMFADQHLSSHSHHSGKRSSLFKKTFETTSDTFLKYHSELCSTFFINYSLKQESTVEGNLFLRTGTIKIINGYPHGVNQVKLTDESTELWQDLNTDNIAEMYPNPLYPTPPAVPAAPVAPEVEFSNISFDVMIENVIRVANQNETAINNWFETVMNTTGIIGDTKQDGDDVIISSADPLWNYTAMLNDLSNSTLSASAEKGDNLKIYFEQNATYTTEISYTIKRWSM